MPGASFVALWRIDVNGRKTWLAFRSGPGGKLFEVYQPSYKNFKERFVFFRPSEGGKQWLFKEDGNPKFPLYWSQDHFNRRSKDYVFNLEELTPSEVTVVKALQAFKEKYGILGCHRILDGGSRSLNDRLGDMAGNNMLALVEKRVKREAAKKAAADAIAAAATGVGSSTPQSTQPGVTSHVQSRPGKRACTEELKDSHDSGKGGDSSTSLSSPQPSSGVPPSPRISWATPDPEEDAAMKLLGQ
ncbi:hypothetical protein SESBI_00335 [Sesbania bispinosa]|nr:hypothetical protein SESBI_00335 [Sesbania bispinosa]